MLSHRQVVQLTLRGAHRRRLAFPVPVTVARPLLRAHETLAGPAAFATWDEAELLTVPMLTPNGTTDAERLGVRPPADGRRPRDALEQLRDLLRAADRGLHLGRHLQQRVLAQRLGDELRRGRQAVVAEARAGSRWPAGPVTFHSDVNGVKRPERLRSAIGSSPQPWISPIGAGRSPRAGVSSRSYSAKKATSPRATACSCATPPR